MASKAVLITGCSTGIGRKTAEHLAQRGWTVYATARRPDSIADLEAKGCKTLALDVTNEESMRAAVAAVEAISDAMRWEVRGFGVDVILIEPGLIKTEFGETAAHSVNEATPSDGPYAEFNQVVAATTAGAYKGRGPTGPKAGAKRIEKAISRKRPGARYPVTLGARALLGVRKVLPARGWDALMRTQFKPPAG